MAALGRAVVAAGTVAVAEVAAEVAPLDLQKV
jgi:hypothetical protein